MKRPVFFSLVLLTGMVHSSATAQNAKTIDLIPTSTAEEIYRVTSRLDGRGTVSPEQEKSVPLRLDARFEYDERIISRQSPLKSIRDYQTARAEIRLGSGSMVNDLSATNQQIIVQSNDLKDRIRVASLGGPLTQNEFELVSTPASTLILGELVRRSQVAAGEKWTPEKDVLARFVNIDSIDESDVELKLEKFDGGIARIFIGGEINGWIDDANTVITISGAIDFDTRRGVATSCELTFSQQRDRSRLYPGLDATFKLATRIQDGGTSHHLTDDGLADLRKKTGKITNDLLLVTRDRQIEIRHTHDWRVIGEGDERSVMRLMENGEMLGQCDIISLPPRAEDQPQTLEQFRKVVETKLETNSAAITATRQATTASGLEWMRVTATGESNGVRLVWNYYTITQTDGRRVQLVFTTEPELSPRFDRQFDALLARIRFRPDLPARNAGFQEEK